MKIGNVVFDCSDPDRVATFWAAALGYEKGEYPPEMRKQLLEDGVTEAELADEAAAGGAKARRRLAPSCGSKNLDDEALTADISYLGVY